MYPLIVPILLKTFQNFFQFAHLFTTSLKIFLLSSNETNDMQVEKKEMLKFVTTSEEVRSLYGTAHILKMEVLINRLNQFDDHP